MKNYSEREDQVQKTLYKKRKVDETGQDPLISSGATKKLKENHDVSMAEEEFHVVDINQ